MSKAASTKVEHPQTRSGSDGDLVRRVLEAEERPLAENGDSQPSVCSPQGDFVSQIRSSLRSRVELERRKSAAAERTPPPKGGSVTVGTSQRRQASCSSDDALVDGLLKEMVKRGDSHAVSR